MMTILHGENTVKSRARLVELLQEKSEQGAAVERVEAKTLARAELETKLVKTDLFGTERVVVIEELHSLPKSQRKNELIELAATSNTDLILWEKRSLTKTMLKKFPQAEVEEFKLSNALFGWLDTLRGNGGQTQQLTALHQALAAEDAYLCLIMLARQVRLLIEIKDGSQPAGPPWMMKKMSHQADSFTMPQLLQLHSRLLEIDLAHKTSTNNLELDQELDLLIINL